MSNDDSKIGCSPTAFHFFLFPVTPRNIEDLKREVGDAMFGAITGSCASWTKENRSRPRGKRAICVDCDAEFDHPFFPAGFLVTIPFAKEGAGIVSGVCHRCIAKPDLRDRVMTRLKTILGDDLHVAKWGNA
jgi:hypothetical protein